MFTKILVGYHGSDKADKALSTAIQWIRFHPTTELEVLYVAKFSHTVIGETYIPPNQRTKELTYEQGETILDRARSVVNAASIKANIQMTEGQPGSVMVEFAEELRCDLIIVGASHHRFLPKLKRHLISSKLLKAPSIPVLIVK